MSKDTPRPYDAIKDMLIYNAIHKKRRETCLRAYERKSRNDKKRCGRANAQLEY